MIIKCRVRPNVNPLLEEGHFIFNFLTLSLQILQISYEFFK